MAIIAIEVNVVEADGKYIFPFPKFWTHTRSQEKRTRSDRRNVLIGRLKCTDYGWLRASDDTFLNVKRGL